MLRVERGTARRSVGTGQLGAQHAVMVEVKRRILRSSQRPFSLVAPATAVVELTLWRATSPAASHEEDSYRRLFLDGRREFLQPAVEPAQLLLKAATHAPDGFGAEVDVADVGGVSAH